LGHNAPGGGVVEPVASMEQIVALACAGGSLFGVLALTAINPDPDALDASADDLAVNLLRMLGRPREEAREIAGGPLPKA